MTHTQAVQTAAAERYLLDEMPELERYAFEEHYFSCVECAEDVRTGAVMKDGVKAGLIDMKSVRAEEPSTSTVRKWRPAAVVPWALAASLALVAGSQSLTPRGSQLQPQALSPVTLRPASRGAEAVVPIAPGAAAVTLAVDVNPDQPGELAYDLRTQGDKSVFSGKLQPPAPGAPLFLLLPVWTLTPGEHYILSVRHAATGNPAGEFRFGVTQ